MTRPAPTLQTARIERSGPPRKELERPLTVLQLHRADPPTFFGYARNISAGGMRIDATSPREPGSRYRVRIPLPAPEHSPAECECEVVWKGNTPRGDRLRPAMGLKFIDLPDEVARTLDEWVRWDGVEGSPRAFENC